eukprot:scaffold15622_cov31-Tisochrysis_lutea.AAC.2
MPAPPRSTRPPEGASDSERTKCEQERRLHSRSIIAIDLLGGREAKARSTHDLRGSEELVPAHA